MTKPVLEILARNTSAMAPATALLDRISAMSTTPPAIANFNRRVAAHIDALTIRKD